jgi:hypothetical protein
VQDVTQEAPTLCSKGQHVGKMDTTGFGGLAEIGDTADDANKNVAQN